MSAATCAGATGDDAILAPTRELVADTAPRPESPAHWVEPNLSIAARLRELADLLEVQAANPYRVSAYRRASRVVEQLPESVADLLTRRGLDGLTDLPGIDRGIGGAIAEMVHTGRWSQLERLRGTLDPEQLFRSLPGVGPTLARQIHEQLHVDTLEGLEVAAHDGRLAALHGLGPRRVRAIQIALAAALARVRPRALPDQPATEPPVGLLLDVDHEYRSRAAAGALPKITPRRFNAEGQAWLPILHTQRGGWHFTALFSNTALAHRLDRIRDWVIIYFHGPDGRERQRTVVTETHGVLKGHRVVRGREAEIRI